MLNVKEMRGHLMCDHFLELPGSHAAFLRTALNTGNAFHILASVTWRTCERSLRTLFCATDDKEWYGGIWGSQYTDSGWHFWWWYWSRQHWSRWVLLSPTPAYKKAAGIAASFWSEEDRRGRKARAASHPPVQRGLWLWLPCVLWPRNLHLQSCRHKMSGKCLLYCHYLIIWGRGKGVCQCTCVYFLLLKL